MFFVRVIFNGTGIVKLLYFCYIVQKYLMNLMGNLMKGKTYMFSPTSVVLGNVRTEDGMTLNQCKDFNSESFYSI